MVTLSQLVTLGAHLSPHSGRHLDNMLGKRHCQNLFDLDKTIVNLRSALKLVEEVTRNEGSLLFVLPHSIDNEFKEELRKYNQFYLCGNWIAGILTNFKKFSLRMQRTSEDYHLLSMPDGLVLLNTPVSFLAVQEAHQLLIPLVAFSPSLVKIPYPIPAYLSSTSLITFSCALFMQAVKEGSKFSL